MISAAITIHTVTDRQPEVEVEPCADGWARVTLVDGDTRACFYGLEDQLIALFNGLTDHVVDMQCRRKRDTPPLFDEEFGICLDPCEHASVNGTTCAACGAEVPF